MFRAFVFAAALLAATPLLAANRYCNSGYCNVVHRDVVQQVVTPQYITNNNFFSVGDSVRYPIVAPQAVVQAEYGQAVREMQRLQDKMNELKQFQVQQPQVICVPVQAQAYCAPPAPQQQAAYCQPGMPQPAQPPAAQPTPPAPQQPSGDLPKFSMKQGGVIEAKCLKCHGGSAGTKGDLDLRGSITCAQFHSAMQRLLTDDAEIRMPKGQPPLTPQETAEAMKELSAMVEESPKEAGVRQPSSRELADSPIYRNK